MNGAMLDKNLFCSHLINANPKTKEQNEQSLLLLLLLRFPPLPSPMAHPALSLTQVTSTARVRIVADPIACHGMELSVILAGGV